MRVGTGEGRRKQNADSAGPLGAAGSRTTLPRAPLQRVTQYDKRSIAGFLTFTEAVSLMLASKDMHRAIKADPLLRLDQISPAFDRLGCNDLRVRIRSVEAGISRLQPNRAQVAALPEPPPESKQQPDPEVAAPGAPADAAPAALALASHWVKLARARAAHASQAMQRARQAKAEKHVHEMEAQKAQLTAQMEALEPGMEAIVFHFAAQRMKGPRPPKPADALAQTVVPATMAPATLAPAQARYAMWHKTIDGGELEMLRAALREFLALPSHLMPNARKVDCLHGPAANSTLRFFARRACGFLEDHERRSYDAIRTYVDEIVSSPDLEVEDKQKILGRLELDDRPAMPPGAPWVRNAPVAACVLLGIQQSSADRELKGALLAALAAPWTGGVAACVGSIKTWVIAYRHRAPEWVDQTVAGLESMETSFGQALQS